MIHQHVNPMVCYPQEPIHFVLGISKARAKSKNSTCFFLFGPCTVISCSFHAFCTQTKHLAAKPVPLCEGQSWGGFSVAIQLHDFVLSLDVFEFLWSMVTELLIVANVWVPTVGSAFISRSCKKWGKTSSAYFASSLFTLDFLFLHFLGKTLISDFYNCVGK